MFTKRFCSIALAAVLAATAATGCSSGTGSGSSGSAPAASSSGASAESTASGEKIQLELWDWWGDGQYKSVIEKLCTDFNDSQDKIEVKHVNYPWGDVWTKALAATASGNPPDVIIQDIRTVTARAQAKQATNLQPFIDKEDGMKDKFYPQLWDAMLYEGNAYGLPYVTDTRILYYDKDAFKEAGLDPEAPPQTWDQLIEYARKLDKKDANGQIERLGFFPNTIGSWDAWAYIADGKDFVDAEGNVNVNTPEKIQLFDRLYKDCYEFYGKNEIDMFTGEFGSGMTNPFVSGKVAMWVNTPTEFTKVRDFAPEKNYGVALLPELEAGKGHHSWGGGFSVEIPYGAKNAEASFEFAKFITSKESQVYWASQVYDTVANLEASEDASLKEIPVYEMAIKAMPETVVTMDRLSAKGAADLVKPFLDEIILGNKSAKEALDEAQKQVEDLKAQSK